MHEMQKMQFEN